MNPETEAGLRRQYPAFDRAMRKAAIMFWLKIVWNCLLLIVWAAFAIIAVIIVLLVLAGIVGLILFGIRQL